MKLPIRMSVALDEETAEILESLRSPGTSQSDVVRRALRFYNSFKDLRGQDLERIRLHEEILSSGAPGHIDSFLGHHTHAVVPVFEGSGFLKHT
jgi:Arc/MetJ-type ribon-helix-helix transcriptional regulator